MDYLKRIFSYFQPYFLIVTLAFALSMVFSNVMAAEKAKSKKADYSNDDFMTLGTGEGTGGEDFMKFDRNQIKNQIKTFIPPLLRPAFTQHAFVLPPKAYTVSVAHRFTHLDGEDFFKDGESNLAVFEDFELDRHLTDFDLFYGFDLNRKYLHGFTLRINVPYFDSQTNGFINPNGQQFIQLFNAGSTQAIGDIGIFLKKKILDQGNAPFGFAIAGAVFLPTGKNDEKFGSNGRITAQRPTPPNTTVAQGFDALMAANVANGTWGAPPCFFTNFNEANRAMCGGAPFSAPAAGPLSFAPGGANFSNAFVGDFPFNDGVFGRFSPDGRLPAGLQPGTGTFSYLAAAFLTRQFNPGKLFEFFGEDFPGRSALHIGANHKFVFSKDGIDPGDTTTFFGSFVKPVYKDYLSMDLTFVGFAHQADSYEGKIPEPEIHTCNAGDIGIIGSCGAVGDSVFIFDLVNRPAFSKGLTGLLAPSLIFSPDPQIRITLSGLYRVMAPELGPAPPWVVRAGLGVTF